MQIRIKSMGQNVSFEDDSVTNTMIFEVEFEGSREDFVAVIDDIALARLIELKHGVAKEDRAPVEDTLYETHDYGAPQLSTRGLPPQHEEFPLEDELMPAQEAVHVFGGAAAEPPTPLELRGKTIEQQLKEVKGKNATNRSLVYNGGPTVAKDDYGYPIVPGLKKTPVVRDGDEDGIGQA